MSSTAALVTTTRATPVDEGIAFCETTLARPGLRPGLEGRVRRALGVLRAMQEDFEAGRALIESSLEIFLDLGLSFYVAAAHQARGILELLDAYRTRSTARVRQAVLDAAVREAEIELEFVSGWEIR